MTEDDPLKAVYSFVERAYVRLQAGDMLIRCLEESNTSPIQVWVEGLVLAGPQNIGTLREILAEVGQRKSQASDDLQQVLHEIERGLKECGFRLNNTHQILVLATLTPVRFLAMLSEQEILDEKAQVTCLDLLRDTRDLIANLIAQLRLLEEIENYLRDWMWGLVYQSTHLEQADIFPDLLS
jgi:hypothetical protein